MLCYFKKLTQVVPVFLATISNCTKCLFHTLQKTVRKFLHQKQVFIVFFDNQCCNNKPDSPSNWIPHSVNTPNKGICWEFLYFWGDNFISVFDLVT